MAVAGAGNDDRHHYRDEVTNQVPAVHALRLMSTGVPEKAGWLRIQLDDGSK